MTAYSPDPRDLGPDAGRGGRSGSGARGDRGAPAGTGSGAGARSTADTLARAARYSRWDGSQYVADLDADEILDALADDVMAEGDLSEALRRLMERGWRTGDPDPRRPGRPPGPAGSAPATTRGDARALQAQRRPRRHPPRARGDRRAGALGRGAPARPGLESRRRPGARFDAARRGRETARPARWPARRPRRADPRAAGATTSSSRRPASGSTSS